MQTVNKDSIEWAMKCLNEKAFGGKCDFSLDEIVPKLEEGIAALKKENEQLRELTKQE